MAKTGVLFVCLGNICRSPLAEGIFRHLAETRGVLDQFDVDSAGTGAWHVGEPPDGRSAEVARRHGIHLDGNARQVKGDDFSEFDLIVAMDRENLRSLERHHGHGSGGAVTRLLRTWDPQAENDLDVPDPYYGGGSGFDRVFDMVERSCRALLDDLSRSASLAEDVVLDPLD